MRLLFSGLILIVAASLLLTSVGMKDRLEKVFADDYDTYVHPVQVSGFSFTCKIDNRPDLLWGSAVSMIFLPILSFLNNLSSGQTIIAAEFSRRLFLLCCRFLL